MVSAANARREAVRPAASMPTPAARYCRRVMVVIVLLRDVVRSALLRRRVVVGLLLLIVGLLLLLHAELADAGRNVVERLYEHLLQLLRRRRHRDGAGLLDHRPVLGRRDDGRDMALQQVDDGLRRAGAGADAKPSEAHEVDAFLRERRNVREALQAFGRGNRQNLELPGLGL